MKITKEQKAKSLEDLKNEYLKDGSTVYTVVCTVARSGMSRTIKVYSHAPKCIHNITWHVSNVLGYTLNKDNEMRVAGCGLDIGYHVMAQLEQALVVKLKHAWL